MNAQSINDPVRPISDLEHIPRLTEEERPALAAVAERYVFHGTDYYLGLIDWNDPADPIRRLVIPHREELLDWGELDASNEGAVTVTSGVRHKYPDTALLFCNNVCGAFCRHCLRKRLFMNDNGEVGKDIYEGLNYIAQHPEVTNVLLTGGDPLLLSTRRLLEIIAPLRAIDHVRVIRLGSKMPAFNPGRILNDPDLVDMLSRYSTLQKRIYLMCHFDHPRELTDTALEGLDRLIRSGVILTNQCPLIKGINDDPQVLSELFRRLSWAGCPPYYLFQGRPTADNAPYRVPIVRGWEIFQEAMLHGAGRARFVMSHETGKIEILMVDAQHITLRYHRANDPHLMGRLLVYKRDDEAHWLDELEPADESDAPRFSHPRAWTLYEGLD